MSQQVDPLIGRLVDGRYRVRARIARGGMATVYVATDLRLERRIALKVMHGHLSDDSVFQSRFIQEARAAARLSDPHVVNVFDQGQDGELAYLVMEYLPGITMRELLREQRRLTVVQTITIMDAVLSGLAAAHRAGIVHRDVKPENVLLAEDGRIKIGDFGLARATSANTATGQQLLGTIAYLAPELVTRGTADARSDIYALGIMLYEMLAGEQPYQGEQPMQIAFQHATESVARPSVKNPGVPEPLDELVLWATEKSPDERPVDAQEMLDRLREIERQLDVTPVVTRTATTSAIALDDDARSTGDVTKVLPDSITAPTAAVGPADNTTRLRQRARKRRGRGAWLLALVLVLAVAAAGAGWWWGSGPGSQVTVPDLTGLDYEQARGVLADENLDAEESGVDSLDVEAGTVVDTEPAIGEVVDQDTVVTVNVSLGPAEVQVDALPGQTQEAATTALDELGIDVREVREYFLDATPGNVTNVRIVPRGTEDVIDCIDGCTAHAGDEAILSVSIGGVPNVLGMSVPDATDELADAELDVAGDTVEQYSSEFASGEVMAVGARSGGGPWRPGDVVTLTESLGPEVFDVPDVTGMTRDEAKAELTEAGFDVAYNPIWDALIDSFTEVTGMNPDSDSRQPHDTTITLTITGSL